MNLTLIQVWRSDAIIFCRMQFPAGIVPESGTVLHYQGQPVATISGHVSHTGFFDAMRETIAQNMQRGIYDCSVMMVEDVLFSLTEGAVFSTD